jgi:hypothetical protein
MRSDTMYIMITSMACAYSIQGYHYLSLSLLMFQIPIRLTVTDLKREI